MIHTNNTQAKSFEISYNNSLLVPIWDASVLWMNQKDLSKLFGVTGVELFCEAEKVFKAKIFSRKENTAYFDVAGERKMYFRMGFLISLGYRLGKQDAVKFIIKINRIIKNKCQKQEVSYGSKTETSKNILDAKYIGLLEEILTFGKTFGTTLSLSKTSLSEYK